MNKIIIAPDSFKGTMTAKKVADIIGEAAAALLPDCEIVKIPIADGGEGSLDTIISSVGGELFEARVISPDDNEIPAYVGITREGTAIIEMAQSSGLTRQNGLHPMTSSTYGFGQLITAALDKGAREFVLCIGGSATTDGGCGMAAALGVAFKSCSGVSFVPCGGTLQHITRPDGIDMSAIDTRIRGSVFTVMCDVDNPLHGKHGAAYVYATQKGASPDHVALLDEGLKHLGLLLHEKLGVDFASIPGAGAAGGLGAGCMAFLSAKLVSGSEAILELSGFGAHLKSADLVITGEGRLDTQSFSGKALSGVLKRAGNVRVYSICGVCSCDEALLEEHSLRVFETSEGITPEESLLYPEKYLRATAVKAITAAMNE